MEEKMVELTETELEMLCKAAWMQAKNLKTPLSVQCTKKLGSS